MNLPYRTFTFDKPICSDELIRLAKNEIAGELVSKPIMHSPELVKDFLILELGRSDIEQFYCMFLDAKQFLTDAHTMFRGSIDHVDVYPREVVRAVMDRNAASIIIAHNRTSKVAEPTQRDHRITDRLQKALALIDVCVLDHVVVAGDGAVSFRENGWL